ncbi:hypothetical protein HHL11_07120 [Ramlibacter sp. G-1-2-2]|uniref:Helix-turn-helix domain-containing protein n=1 Tax=Ramlibacter agri TaxID=2728837 RepID=A0A848H4F3_9BURK|nr:hypothetical protein [Ramlibacter agri]NML43513.1 hypothetical protein [Ramlibacter agri]
MAGNKAPKDPRGGHVRLYWELLDSNAWRALSATDQRIYIALLRHLRSTNNGDLSLPLSVARHHGITSKTTLAKSLRALQAVGFIAVTRKGGATRGGQRMPTLYRITDLPVLEVPAKHIEARKATFDWKQFASMAQAEAAIRASEKAAEDDAGKTETQGQKMTHTGSEIGPVEPITGSKNGPWLPGPGQKLTLGKCAESAANPMLARVSR